MKRSNRQIARAKYTCPACSTWRFKTLKKGELYQCRTCGQKITKKKEVLTAYENPTKSKEIG